MLRRTMALSNARAMLTPVDLDNWSNMFPAALVPPCLPQEVRAPQRLQSCWQRLSPAQPKRSLLLTRFSWPLLRSTLQQILRWRFLRKLTVLMFRTMSHLLLSPLPGPIVQSLLLSGPRPWRKGSRSSRGSNLSC